MSEENNKNSDNITKIERGKNHTMPSIKQPLSDKSKSTLSRLEKIIRLCGTATEMNETDFSIEVKRILQEAGLYKSQWDLKDRLPDRPIQVDEETQNLMITIIAKLESVVIKY